MRRVVVTGLGAITPLGVGIRQTWKRLLASESGISSIAKREPSTQWRELPSTVAGIVPEGGKDEGKWQASEWLQKGEERRMARFTQFAIAGTEMALQDAGWNPTSQEEKDRTGVCLGSGIGNLEQLYDTSVAYQQTVSNHSNPVYALCKLRLGIRAIRKYHHYLFHNSSSTSELAIYQ